MSGGPEELPDVEDAAKQWTKEHEWLVPLHGGRVFFSLPPGAVQLPAFTVSLLSETPDLGPAITRCRLTWQLWAPTKNEASDCRRALISALRYATGTLLQPTVWCDEVLNIFSMYAPDDDSKLRRYIVDADVLARAVVPA